MKLSNICTFKQQMDSDCVIGIFSKTNDGSFIESSGKSGIGASDLLAKVGARPVIYDGKADIMPCIIVFFFRVSKSCNYIHVLSVSFLLLPALFCFCRRCLLCFHVSTVSPARASENVPCCPFHLRRHTDGFSNRISGQENSPGTSLHRDCLL